MPHGHNHAQHWREINESILNHLFLPIYLPSSAESDFCLRSNHRNEHVILESMNEFLNSFESSDTPALPPMIQLLSDCTQRWLSLQKHHQHLTVSHLQSTFTQIPTGAFLPLYFHAQNAAILIDFDENNNNGEQPCISAWQVLLPLEIMINSIQPHLSCFPTPTYRLSDRSQLTSTVHCELLVDFMKHTIEYPKSSKASREVIDTKDVPLSHYVCQWWIQHFLDVKIETNSDQQIQFNKKHRDQVRWHNGVFPFRRSGLWMTIKVVFQTILTKRLGNLGKVIYKLLITQFLTHFLYTCHTSMDSLISVDLMVHCIRKIMRRLNKIDTLLSVIDSTEINVWIQWTKQKIQQEIDAIFPNMDWVTSAPLQALPTINVNLNDEELYRHSCKALRKYLTSHDSKSVHHTSSHKYPNNYPNTSDVDPITSPPSYSVLIDQHKYTVGIALIHMEISITSWLDQWMRQPPSAGRETEHFQTLLRFYNDYQQPALNYYCPKKSFSDSIGYSRFILTSLTVIRAMHFKLCQDKRFERLSQHCIDLGNVLDLFEYLVLPHRDDMCRARDLYDYFKNFTHRSDPDLLNSIAEERSFGVRFADESNKINSCLRKLQTQVEKDKATKIQEVHKAKEKYYRLMNSINGFPCMCSGDLYIRECRRCRIEQQANSIEVDIYECPLPSERASALAVLFELRMPIEFRCYRDVLWLFTNRFQLNSDKRMYEWLRVLPHAHIFGPLYTGPTDSKVKLVSSNNSITQSVRATPSIAFASPDDFLYENSLQVEISPVRSLPFDDERQLLTPQLNHPDYKQLQYALTSTEFVQNRVIADLSQAQHRLKPKQFIEFGSFRSGHRLQWWNLLAMLEMDSLSLNEESVTILIIHSVLQYGPMTDNVDLLISPWCPESHQSLLDDHFVDELLLRLNRHLDQCASNWQNERILVAITIITMRILTICNDTRKHQVVELAFKCRRLGEKWIDLISARIESISSSNFDDVETLRLSMVIVGVACLWTFLIHPERMGCLLGTNSHLISYLKAVTTTHDNIALNKRRIQISAFLEGLIRWSDIIAVQAQPAILALLQKLSFQSLNDFAAVYWVVIRNEGMIDGRWRKRKHNIYDGWYDGQYESTEISIDCVQGIFLVNGMSIGYLPIKIINNPLYVRVFGQHIFQVQMADSPNTYITKYSYHGDEHIFYEFYFDDTENRLIVHERHTKTNEIIELIPPQCLDSDLPVSFIAEYSHWKKMQSSIIEFRPIHFKDPEFFISKPYVLNIDTGFLTTTDVANEKVLVNQSSTLFQHWFSRYFQRLDEKPHVYMMRDDPSNLIGNKKATEDVNIHIYLSRLSIAFQYNSQSHHFTSREYPDMFIDEEQRLGTLIGLKSGLLLSSHENFKGRKLIVPYGHVSARRSSPTDHQIVAIERASSMPYAHHYFVFLMNDRLRIIQSRDSPTGWLYLALLHALTAHPLADPYTGMTGMERAFQLLHSAGSWTDQPFDSLSLAILRQIATIAPKANYSGQHRNWMPKIEWNSQSIPYSLQHSAYYLIAKKMLDASEKFNFMYPSAENEEVVKLTDDHEYDEKLLIKLYWDYRHYYNPTAQLSAQIETDLLNVGNEKPYQSVLGNNRCLPKQDHTNLVNDIYASGDVLLKDVSELRCFPLSRWLTEEYRLSAVWIGLLKLADAIKSSSSRATASGEMERFQLLLDFLHYMSGKQAIRPIYIQILDTVLRSSTVVLTSVTFPPFTQYHSIQHISVTMSAIDFNSCHSASQRRTIVEEVRECFEAGCMYKDFCRLATSEEKNQIKFLMKSWQLNRKLHTFLTTIQNLISSSDLVPWHTSIYVELQHFMQKSLGDHHRLELNSTGKSIDRQLLVSAQQKYLHSNAQPWMTSAVVDKINSKYQPFPDDIFSSIDDQNSHLSDIGNYFKHQLDESWQQLQSTEICERAFPSEEELRGILQSLHEESNRLWKAIVESVTGINEHLFQIGLLPRMTPTIVISLLQQMWLDDKQLSSMKGILSEDQCILLGGMIVNWIVEQQLERALSLAYNGQREEYEKELANTPHTNWIPAEHLPWLILELEMNITIRDIQVDVARHMMEPTRMSDDTKVRNIVMQMNMGEGKTAVIIPMLAVSLSSPVSSLVRVVVLKSLFPTNYQSLRCKLGGLLNRRIFSIACRRDMDFSHAQVQQIFNRLQQGLQSCDVILVSPEDILSFDLLTIDKCRRHDYETGRSMLMVQRWLKTYARDILDESDEILHCKYQLIYTVGAQRQVDAGVERWKLIQSVLHSVKKFAVEVAQSNPDDVYYKSPRRTSAFPELRLLSHRPFPKFAIKIVHDWLNQKSYRKSDKQCILSFVLDMNTSMDSLIERFSSDDIQLFLILRGLLSAEVLFSALKKRYRVNYGVNVHSHLNRLMAVPFRAKDVPAERTEFGHPDTALVLTQLAYYYSGLNDGQLMQCFTRLNEEERDPESIYTEWLAQEEESEIPQTIKQWKSVNLKDCQQEIHQIFVLLHYNMLVINYYLNHFVYPREVKQFPHKLVASAWDLASELRTGIITGFSGTNDTQLLLPLHIRQCDLPQLHKTDAIVIQNLLQPSNENYRYLSGHTTSESILTEISKYQPAINVILDVGALLIDGTNRDIAVQWLKLSDKNKIDYAIYFQFDTIMVCDRQNQHYTFLTSPASERLDRCVIYLDEVHTRGTDFKFPNGFKAAVTLGNGLTKDRFVQACMRMRKLGQSHSLSFWSSDEVHRQIMLLKARAKDIGQPASSCRIKDILRWVYENTQQAIWDGLHHWAVQSLSFQRKVSAFQKIHWTDHQQTYTDQIMEELAEKCLEPETIELKRMYGIPKVLHTISAIYTSRYEQLNVDASEELHQAVLQRISTYGGSKQRLSQFLDEEQQREIEQEFEQEQQREPEYEQKSSQLVFPCKPILHEEVKKLCDTDSTQLNLAELTRVFRPLPHAFIDSTFVDTCQNASWYSNFWITSEFQRVIESQEELLDPYLRSPRWIIVYYNEHVIFLSPFEANWLMGQLYYPCNLPICHQPSPRTTLRLLLPRLKRHQSIFVNTPALTIPPFTASHSDTMPFILPVHWLVQLFVFNGTLYFETPEEQTAFCQCFALCLKPRTMIEENAFENGWIAVDGFVRDPEHRPQLQINQARFHSNPLTFIRELLRNRNNTYPPVTSHVGNIIFNAIKPFPSE